MATLTNTQLPRRVVVVLVVAIALILGFGVAATLLREDAPSNFSGAPSVDQLELPASGARPSPSPVQDAAVIVEPTSARQALEQFLTAEIDRRSDVAFPLLDPATRKAVGTVAAWQAERANRLLPETFTIRGERRTASGVDVTIAARRKPDVNNVSGLVPAASEEVWQVVDDGGWRVKGGRAREVRPTLPNDDVAVAAATAWLDAAIACDGSREALQLPGELLGSNDLAEAPCKRSGAYVLDDDVKSVAELSNATVFVTAYGPGTGRWGRAIAVTGERRFTIVLAPLGDEWRVMGLVPDGSPSP